MSALLHSAYGNGTPHLQRQTGRGIYDNVKSAVKKGISILTEKPLQAVAYAGHKLADWRIIPEQYRSLIDGIKTVGSYFGKGSFRSGAGHQYVQDAQRKGHPLIIPVAVLKKDKN